MNANIELTKEEYKILKDVKAKSPFVHLSLLLNELKNAGIGKVRAKRIIREFDKPVSDYLWGDVFLKSDSLDGFNFAMKSCSGDYLIEVIEEHLFDGAPEEEDGQ